MFLSALRLLRPVAIEQLSAIEASSMGLVERPLALVVEGLFVPLFFGAARPALPALVVDFVVALVDFLVAFLATAPRDFAALAMALCCGRW